MIRSVRASNYSVATAVRQRRSNHLKYHRRGLNLDANPNDPAMTCIAGVSAPLIDRA